MTRTDEVSWGAKVFVAVVFSLLGASFLATTVALFLEFRETSWFTIAAVNSHLFIFFPTFGLLALCAFYIPASVFVDLYWRKFAWGRLRLALGALAVAVVSLFVGQSFMGGDVPAVWWLKPEVLRADREEPPACWRDGNCRRVGVLQALEDLRNVSQRRTGLAALIRRCDFDPYVELPPERLTRRYCFVNQQKMTADECCRAQVGFVANLKQLYTNPANRSGTFAVHAATLPLKVFFLLVILIMGGMLLAWRSHVDRHYASHEQRIERGVLIGAVAMLLWPICNHAFLQTSIAIYGAAAQSTYASASPGISLLFGAWALLLLMYFYRQGERDLEAAAKIIGALASVIAVLKYNEIIDYASRFVGAGSDPYEIGALALALAIAFVVLLRKSSSEDARSAIGTGEAGSAPARPDNN